MANRRQSLKQTNKPTNQQTKKTRDSKIENRNSLDYAIIKTLAYADVFDQALSVEELHKLLVGESASTGELQRLVETRDSSTEYRDGFVCLKGRGRLLNLKFQQQQTANRKLQTAKKYIWLFKLVPWVKLVCVTGSVAGGTPTVNDDIDLLVVSDKSRLWLTRLAVTFLISLTGKRRKPSDDPHHVNNKLCLNMWLSEEHLASEQEDEYVANELARMVPVLNRDGMYEKYIGENGWLEGVMPNLFRSVQRPASSVQRSESDSLQPSAFTFLNWLDSQLERWQRGRMRKVTRETVEDDLLMFHPRDYRSEVLEKYREKLKLLGLD